jgi:phosphate transport system permease protein
MPFEITQSRRALVKLTDRIARAVITLGGIIVIGSVIAVMVLLISVIFPLFGGTSTELRVACPLPSESSSTDVLRLGVDLVELGQTAHEDALSAYSLAADGTMSFFDFVADRNDPKKEPRPVLLSQENISPPEGSPNELIRVEQSSCSEFTLLWADGAVSLVQASAIPVFDDLGTRSVRYEVETPASLKPDEAGKTIRATARGGEEGSVTCARLLEDNRVVVVQQTVVSGLLGGSTTETSRLVVDDLPGKASALAVNRKGDALFVGTEEGHLSRWRFNDDGDILSHETVMLPDSPAVTALTMVFGDFSIAVGDAKGRVTTWAPVRKSEESDEAQSLRLDSPTFPARRPSSRNSAFRT